MRKFQTDEINLKRDFRRGSCPWPTPTWAILIVAATAVAAAAQPARIATLADGSTQLLRLEHIDSQWTLQGRDDSGRPLQLDRRQLASWGELSDLRPGDWIVLANGSRFMADLMSLDAHSVGYGLDPFDFGEIPLWRDGVVPRSLVAGILLQAPADPVQRERLLHTIQTSTDPTDRVIFRNGDVVTGKVLAIESAASNDPALPADAPPIGQPNPSTLRTVKIETASRTLSVSLALVQALVLSGERSAMQAPASKEASAAWLGFSDGGLLAVQSLRWSPQSVSLDLNAETALQMDRDEFLRRMVYLEPPNERIVYLDTLPALSYRHLPFLEDPLDYQRNLNVLQQPLSVTGARYRRGLGMPSAARLAFAIPAEATQFAALAALDDAADNLGSVRFRVYLETTAGQWQAAYESPLLQGGDPAAHVHVPLEKGKAIRLALLVDYGQRGDVCDYANWLAPRFVLDAPE